MVVRTTTANPGSYIANGSIVVSFVWPEYLTLATELTAGVAPSVSHEARWRCAISRAYYTAYHAALLRAHQDGYHYPGNTPSHAALIQYYRQHRDPRWQTVGETLHGLRGTRTVADYILRAPPPGITERVTTLHLQIVRRVLREIQAL
jgi:hypothetical protein